MVHINIHCELFLFTLLFSICIICSDAFLPPVTRNPASSSSCRFPTHIQYVSREEDGTNTDTNSDTTNTLPSCIQSPVLRQVYPAMLVYFHEYGHSNIPLGNSDGKKCKTLRRLAFQKKLTEDEMELLTSINFRFNSFEDVYDEADFDECLQRLVDYETEHKTGYQIPKKYKPDPELGAWVTLIRRIGSDNIDPDRRDKLNEIGFAWVSTRKCGSVFMSNFRPLKERLEACAELNEDGEWVVVDEDGVREVLEEDGVKKWVKAQRGAAENGNLSDARCGYLDALPGLNWREF